MDYKEIIKSCDLNAFINYIHTQIYDINEVKVCLESCILSKEYMEKISHLNIDGEDIINVLVLNEDEVSRRFKFSFKVVRNLCLIGIINVKKIENELDVDVSYIEVKDQTPNINNETGEKFSFFVENRDKFIEEKNKLLQMYYTLEYNLMN